MSLENRRFQWPVGQGFFHSGALIFENNTELHYVYDCGAMPKYKAAREAAISDCINLLTGKKLDLLFISHVHADHVNGLPSLLDKKSGINVDTIIMPFVNVEERIYSYAMSCVESPEAATNEFYQAFIVDPEGELSKFGPNRILFVEGGESGAPGRDGDLDLSPLDDPDDLLGVRDDRDRKWKMIGTGKVKPNEESNYSGIRSCTIPDSAAILSVNHSDNLMWVLSPYIDPVFAKSKTKFLKALAKEKGMSLQALSEWLQKIENIKILVTLGISDLKAAFSQVTNNLNISSMCLYSGPLLKFSSVHSAENNVKIGKWHSHVTGIDNTGWLATGDAALKKRSRCEALLTHYGQLLADLVTMTLPHHGSDHNFNIRLVNELSCEFYVAAADKYANWKHPGPFSIQSVASKGRFVNVVTSSKLSGVVENVRIRQISA